jgi:hypothetical protein
MRTSRTYYMVEQGSAAHDFCVGWRMRMGEIGDRLTAWAEAQGADRWIPGFDGAISSLIFLTKEAPAGWRKAKGLSTDGYERWIPAVRSPEGKALVKEIATLEVLPSHDEFCEKFGFPRAVNVKGPNSTGMWALAPGSFDFCTIGWIGDTYWIVLPDVEAFKARCYEENVTIQDEIVIPDGLIKSTRTRYDLALAQFAVDQEEKEAA